MSAGLTGEKPMMNSKAPLNLSKFLMILVASWSMACSVQSNSQASSNLRDQESLSLAFKDCVISTVLKGSNMNDAKKSCLVKAQKACDENTTTKNSCLAMVSKATKEIVEQGQSVDCDSGFCTIVYK
jgi:hypothetical protein